MFLAILIVFSVLSFYCMNASENFPKNSKKRTVCVVIDSCMSGVGYAVVSCFLAYHFSKYLEAFL